MQTIFARTAQTQTILGHHLEALSGGDLEATLSDYTDSSLLFTPNGVFTGLEQLRGFFTQFIASLTPEFLTHFKLEQQAVYGDYAFITWSSGAAVPTGSDTFLMRDGKIIMQSFTIYMAQQPMP